MAKAITVAMKSFLASATNILAADLYRIILSTGTTLYYTSADVDITFGGHTYLSAAAHPDVPGFLREEIKLVIGLQAEELLIDLLYDTTTLINGVSPGAFAIAAGFDGCRIIVDKLLTDSFSDTSRGVVNLYDGLVSTVAVGSNRVEITVSNQLLTLNNVFPRNYFLPACNHALFDSGCGLSAATFKVSSSVAAGSTNKHINSALAQATGWFSLGYIVFTSGVNNGVKRMVKYYTGGGFDLLYPLPQLPGTGDTFDAYPGCDKTTTMCQTKFNNKARIKAFPFVPTPETIEMGSNSNNPGNQNGTGGAGGMPGTGTGGQSTNFKVQ